MEYFAFIAQDKRNGQGKQPPAWKASEITKKTQLKICMVLRNTGFGETDLKKCCRQSSFYVHGELFNKLYHSSFRKFIKSQLTVILADSGVVAEHFFQVLKADFHCFGFSLGKFKHFQHCCSLFGNT